MVLSKGHAAAGLYAALSRQRRPAGEPGPAVRHGRPPVHRPSRPQGPRGALPDREPRARSAYAAGWALSRRLGGKPGLGIAVTGDGELQEGLVWETCQVAAAQRLRQLRPRRRPQRRPERRPGRGHLAAAAARRTLRRLRVRDGRGRRTRPRRPHRRAAGDRHGDHPARSRSSPTRSRARACPPWRARPPPTTSPSTRPAPPSGSGRSDDGDDHGGPGARGPGRLPRRAHPDRRGGRPGPLPGGRPRRQEPPVPAGPSGPVLQPRHRRGRHGGHGRRAGGGRLQAVRLHLRAVRGAPGGGEPQAHAWATWARASPSWRRTPVSPGPGSARRTTAWRTWPCCAASRAWPSRRRTARPRCGRSSAPRPGPGSRTTSAPGATPRTTLRLPGRGRRPRPCVTWEHAASSSEACLVSVGEEGTRLCSGGPGASAPTRPRPPRATSTTHPGAGRRGTGRGGTAGSSSWRSTGARAASPRRWPC